MLLERRACRAVVTTLGWRPSGAGKGVLAGCLLPCDRTPFQLTADPRMEQRARMLSFSVPAGSCLLCSVVILKSDWNGTFRWIVRSDPSGVQLYPFVERNPALF